MAAPAPAPRHVVGFAPQDPGDAAATLLQSVGRRQLANREAGLARDRKAHMRHSGAQFAEKHARDAFAARFCRGALGPPAAVATAAATALRVTIVQGRKLVVRDRPLLWGPGSSEPRARLRIRGRPGVAYGSRKALAKALCAQWNENASLPVDEADWPIGGGGGGTEEGTDAEGTRRPILMLTIEDVDPLGSGELLGRLDLDLTPFRDQRPWREWYALEPRGVGEVELILHWTAATDEDRAFFQTLEVDPPPNTTKRRLSSKLQKEASDRLAVPRTVAEGYPEKPPKKPRGSLDDPKRLSSLLRVDESQRPKTPNPKRQAPPPLTAEAQKAAADRLAVPKTEAAKAARRTANADRADAAARDADRLADVTTIMATGAPPQQQQPHQPHQQQHHHQRPPAKKNRRMSWCPTVLGGNNTGAGDDDENHNPSRNGGSNSNNENDKAADEAAESPRRPGMMQKSVSFGLDGITPGLLGEPSSEVVASATTARSPPAEFRRTASALTDEEGQAFRQRASLNKNDVGGGPATTTTTTESPAVDAGRPPEEEEEEEEEDDDDDDDLNSDVAIMDQAPDDLPRMIIGDEEDDDSTGAAAGHKAPTEDAAGPEARAPQNSLGASSVDTDERVVVGVVATTKKTTGENAAKKASPPLLFSVLEHPSHLAASLVHMGSLADPTVPPRPATATALRPPSATSSDASEGHDNNTHKYYPVVKKGAFWTKAAPSPKKGAAAGFSATNRSPRAAPVTSDAVRVPDTIIVGALQQEGEGVKKEKKKKKRRPAFQIRAGGGATVPYARGLVQGLFAGEPYQGAQTVLAFCGGRVRLEEAKTDDLQAGLEPRGVRAARKQQAREHVAMERTKRSLASAEGKNNKAEADEDPVAVVVAWATQGSCVSRALTAPQLRQVMKKPPMAPTIVQKWVKPRGGALYDHHIRVTWRAAAPTQAHRVPAPALRRAESQPTVEETVTAPWLLDSLTRISDCVAVELEAHTRRPPTLLTLVFKLGASNDLYFLWCERCAFAPTPRGGTVPAKKNKATPEGPAPPPPTAADDTKKSHQYFAKNWVPTGPPRHNQRSSSEPPALRSILSGPTPLFATLRPSMGPTSAPTAAAKNHRVLTDLASPPRRLLLPPPAASPAHKQDALMVKCEHLFGRKVRRSEITALAYTAALTSNTSDSEWFSVSQGSHRSPQRPATARKRPGTASPAKNRSARPMAIDDQRPSTAKVSSRGAA